MILQSILDDCGLAVARVEPVYGGDINNAYCFSTGDSKYFLKVNDAMLYPGMFEKEARGLDALRNRNGIALPSVHKYGLADGQQYLLLEWIERGKPATDFWESFGSALAKLHRHPQQYFGWTEDNYIGSLQQVNKVHLSWDLFYSECRILPLVEQLFNKNNFSLQETKAAEKLCKGLRQLFPNEQPALLHGDLWSGNFMVASNGHPVFYDPAAYYGHREMDIGMSRLFGGFDQQFYTAYNEAYPLETVWQQRLPLTQLYPLLVHAVLFGGHYISNCRQIILKYA